MVLITDFTDEGFNSFVSLADADAYFAGEYFGDGMSWDDVDEENKVRLLITASRSLGAINWSGSPSTSLAFPRTYRNYEYGWSDGPVMPAFVLALTCQWAKWIWQESDRSVSDGDMSAFKSVKIGELAVVFRDGVMSNLPPTILSMLNPLMPAYLPTMGSKARSMRMVY